jgi:hypothetical protein
MNDLAATIYFMIYGDDEFAIKCLLELYHRQSTLEQSAYSALHDNGIGFTAGDAPFMTAAAKTAASTGTLDHGVMTIVRKRLLKYCRQLASCRNITEDLV